MEFTISRSFTNLELDELLSIDGGWSLTTTLNVIGVVVFVAAAAVAVAALPAVGIIGATVAASTGFQLGVGGAGLVGTILTSF